LARGNQVRVSDREATRLRTYRLLQQYYARSRYWAAFEPALTQVLASLDTTDRLADLSEASTRALLTLTGWRGAASRSSGLSARTDKSQRLADLTCATGATTYLCGTGGARYLDYWPFARRGLQVVLFTGPAHGDPRVWHGATTISALRALMTVGPVALSAELDRHRACLTPGFGIPSAASVPGELGHERRPDIVEAPRPGRVEL
jgi:hypothetical protein